MAQSCGLNEGRPWPYRSRPPQASLVGMAPSHKPVSSGNATRPPARSSSWRRRQIHRSRALPSAGSPHAVLSRRSVSNCRARAAHARSKIRGAAGAFRATPLAKSRAIRKRRACPITAPPLNIPLCSTCDEASTASVSERGPPRLFLAEATLRTTRRHPRPRLGVFARKCFAPLNRVPAI